MKRSSALKRKTPLQPRKAALKASPGLPSTSAKVTPLQRKTGLQERRQGQPKMKQKAPREFAHMGRVKALGCLVCRHQGLGWVPAEAHHIKRDPETGRVLGTGQRAPDRHTIPLCPTHHREGGPGVAFHAGRGAWEATHGNEVDLLAETLRLLAGEAVA